VIPAVRILGRRQLLIGRKENEWGIVVGRRSANIKARRSTYFVEFCAGKIVLSQLDVSTIDFLNDC